MSYDTIRLLAEPTDEIEYSHILIIIRNMAGQDLYLAVKKTATFSVIRFYVALMRGIAYYKVHLMLDYNKLEDTTCIYTLQPLLEKKNNVVDILVDEDLLPPTDFICPNCNQERDIWQCIEWDSDPERRCYHCRQGNLHVCCYGRNDTNIEE